MAATGVTETVATSIDVVAAILQQELIEKAVLLGTVTDYSAWVLPGANTVKLPRTGSFTATNKAENTATTTSSLTFATDDIELNIHGHIVAEMPLPIFGLLSEKTPGEVRTEYNAVNQAARQAGMTFPNPLLSLMALSGAAIPFFRICSAGLVNLKEGRPLELFC